MNLLSLSRIAQIIICILLIILVLIQSKGIGLSSTFGGSISFYRARRGLEKTITIFTVVFGFLLIINSLVIILLS